MPVILTPDSILLFLAVLLAVLFSLHLWVRHRAPETYSLSLIMAGTILWILGAAMQTGLPGFEGQYIWYRVELTGRQVLPAAWLIFILLYIGDSRWLRPRRLLLLALPAGLAILALWTNDWHHLYWSAAPQAVRSLHELTNHTAPLYAAGILIEHVYLLVGLWLLLRTMFIARDRNIAPVAIVFLCTIIPWGTALYFSLVYFETGEKNPFPYVFSLVFVLFVYALIRLRLINVIPIALDYVVAAMQDGVIVFSQHDKIVHLNPAAEKILGLTVSQVFDRPVETALAAFPQLLQIVKLETANTVTFDPTGLDGSPAYYECSLAYVHDRWKNRIGRMLTLVNITSRVVGEMETRESQEKLRRSEETYRQLVENISEIVYTVDCSGVITFISPNVERTTGFSPAEMIGKHFSVLLLDEDQARMQHSLQRTLEGVKTTFEFRLIDKGGATRTMVAHQQRIEQSDGSVSGIQGLLSDITDRIQVEEALERRASQLSILNDIGEKIAALMDLKSVFDQATQLIRNSYGYYHVGLFIPDPETNEVIMRSSSGAFTSFFPGNHRLKFGQGIVGWAAQNGSILLANDVRREPRYTNLYPEKIVTRSELAVPVMLGEELVGVLDIQSPEVNAFDENDVRVMKTIANQIAIAIENARLYEEARVQLTETERKENMLRIQRDLIVAISSATAPEEMLATTVETLAMDLLVPRVAVFLVDSASGCLTPTAVHGFSEAGLQRLVSTGSGVAGWVARSHQPMLIGDLQEIPDYRDAHADTRSVLCVPLLSGSEIIGIIHLESPKPFVFLPDDLRLLLILANNLAMLIERARLFQEVERARSELEERASALQAANERLRELDRIKSHFLANMSHELRTPLNSIIGFSEILIDNLAGPLNADQADCIDNIHGSGKHLLALINDLLDFSKIEAGKMELEPATFEVAEMFDEVRSTILPLTEKKAQRLGYIIEDNLPPLTADRLRLKQVFLNLLSNANKFTPEGGEINMTCRRAEPDHLLFSFQDNGIGIEPEHQELIFEEFRQVDGSMSRQAAGTGLGLAISKHIVQMHRGSIWVESRLGEGATFYVSVPVCYQADMI